MGAIIEPSINNTERRILIKAMNKGRRPIYIRMIGGKLMRSGWFGYHICDSEFGCKLEEGQCYEDYWKGDKAIDGTDINDVFVNIFIEDSLGNRYKVPNSKKLLKKYMSSNT